MARGREYAQLVDSSKIGLFKDVMKGVSQARRHFPEARDCFVESSSHSGGFEYRGPHRYKVFGTTEGLGNKNWIAEWMYQQTGDPLHFLGIGGDTALMAVNDLIANGAMPVIYLDEVAAADSEWFTDTKRANVIGKSYYDICSEVRMALPAGESPALRYLVRAKKPVKSAPIMSGAVIGIIAPVDRQVPDTVMSGDSIIGVYASGLHCNGVSIVIKRAMALPYKFLTRLPNERTLGAEALIRTTSYVKLVESLLNRRIKVHKLLPGTGDGVAKLGTIRGDLTYRIHFWPKMPLIFEFMHEIGMSMYDLLTTFNCGIGYYVIVPKEEEDRTLEVVELNGYRAAVVGRVEEGMRGVVFGPQKDLWLPHLTSPS